ncbi:Tn3 family transposase [Flagellimonas sp. CMM7]|uniref:Tn3 family transposase n=1 Tax=Flagellimonas sp. CMM7 TaxID=2654676 RepID=UPI0013D6ED9F|nr:Tn3 family transposase [Flagellimonas sp. CMM7]UII79557.1 Tn3 family transposase [Flagellimonas sp. CMM7]
MPLNIYSENEIREFDKVPLLDDEDRQTYLDISSSTEYRDYFRKPVNFMVFVLMKGYFKYSGRFYRVSEFREEDIQFVIEQMNIAYIPDFSDYARNTFTRQKKIIAKSIGARLFADWRESFEKEVDGLVRTALKPKQIIKALVRICQEKKVELPSYRVFVETISTSLKNLENELLEKVGRSLSDDQKSTIDTILKMEKSSGQPISPTNPYLITTIKSPEQEIAPMKIKESLTDFSIVADLYREFRDCLDSLELSDQLLNYYAVWLIKSTHIQFLALKEQEKRHLYFLAFIVYQYRMRQDLFVDTLLKSVLRFESEVKKSITEDFLSQRPVKLKQTQKIIKMVRSLSDYVDDMRSAAFNVSRTDKEKINEIQDVFSRMDNSRGERQAQRKKIEEELEKLQNSLSSGMKDQMVNEKYISGYRRIQNRVSGIISVLDFNVETSNKDICEAIDYFKANTNITKPKKLPKDFLDDKGKSALRANRESEWKLWKVLFFIRIKELIKSGALNLRNSNRYRAVEEYLISSERWKQQKVELLKRAGLPFKIEPEAFLKDSTILLHDQYIKTNKNVSQNEHLSFTKSGSIRVATPKEDKKKESSGLVKLLENENGSVIPLPIVLSEINTTSKFIDCFSHFSLKGQKGRPSNQAFYATIIAIGCNIGTGRMAQISNGISAGNLNHLVKWYFSKENLDAANGRLNTMIDELSLPKIYKKRLNENHTSSDGQKFSVTVPSIHANHSYKYFGTGKGVTAYSFIDETSSLFYNTVISSSEREAAYVIDGLMHNEDVESDIHSTDTHGYSEIIFAITNGLGVFFAPRIKNLKNQVRYTFRENPKRSYEAMNFNVLPTATQYIDNNLIVEQWDNILRLLVTIKLREITASRILKRLSSYSKQHPLYRALKQIGRIFKTYFILKYMDELDLRKSTEKALNRIENSHQFAKAIFFGNNQSIKAGSKEEQEVIVATRHLIQNVIVLWNYLKISERLSKCDSKGVEEILSIVKNGSIMTWQHINIHGEYNFQRLFSDGEKSSLEFEKIKQLNIDSLVSLR